MKVYKPFKVEITERDAKFTEGDVRPGHYEAHPDGSLKRARIYRRELSKGARGVPSLRRVKDSATIAAVMQKVNAR